MLDSIARITEEAARLNVVFAVESVDVHPLCTPELLRTVLDTAADIQHCKVIFDPVNLFCAKDGQDKAYQTAHWSRWLEVIGSQLGAVHVKDCRIEADGSKTLLPLGEDDRHCVKVKKVPNRFAVGFFRILSAIPIGRCVSAGFGAYSVVGGL